MLGRARGIMIRVSRDFAETRRVLAKFEAQARKAIYLQSGYIRATARNSMRPGKPGRPSAPGSPPHYITRLLKDFLFFSWDPIQNSMVIGPAAIGRSTTPRVLEEGGTSGKTYFKRGTQWVKGTVQIKARPYMAPALQKSQEKLSEFWSKSVRAA